MKKRGNYIRHKAREIALQVLYQSEVSQEDLKTTWQVYCEHYHPLEEAKDYAWKLLQGVEQNRITIDLIIERYSADWRIERMSIIDRNILRIAVYEMFFEEDVPPKVSINEAIELAKAFSSKTAPAFVNGILDAIYHQEIKKE